MREIIDLIVLDMVMQDMNGGGVFDHLNEINRKDIIILVSGYSIDGKATEILNRGCNGFFQKPFSREDLAGKISSILVMSYQFIPSCRELSPAK